MENNKAINSEIRVDLCGVVIANIVNDEELKRRLSNIYSNFITKRRPLVSINIKTGFIPNLRRGLSLRESKFIVGRSDGKLFFKMFDKGLALSDLNFRSLTFYSKKADIDALIILHYLLINRLLISDRGALIHACAVKINNKACLFIAPSGGGKTTIARLFRRNNIIHDDQILIKKSGTRYIASAIPWSLLHQDNHKEEITLNKIFFIEKSKKNYIQPLSRIDSFKRIVKSFMNSFPITDIQSLNLFFGFFSNLVDEVPCYKLKFFPNRELFCLLQDFKY